ncbi:MAG: beta-glucosidase [Chloroflexota bacterium]|nr:beta-glucosidase [Chloroflexota bacterium]
MEFALSLFDSFFLAGFESACHINRAGERLNMLQCTQHDQQVDADYELLRSFNIRTVRDGTCWPLIEQSGQFDFSSLAPMVEAAERHGMQVLWNVLHYGCPNDVDIFAPSFAERFARYCKALARYIDDHSDRVPFYTPINEISFLAWAAGDVGYIHPFGIGRGIELKRQLIRAAIAGIEAIWDVNPDARIVQVEPVIHVIAPRDRPDLAERAAAQRAGQFEAWDMMSGEMMPELGGHPQYLDIMGLNYYHSNQWEHPDVRLPWEANPRDDRWMPLHKLLAEVYERYRRPLFIGETSHFGAGRGPWLREVHDEVQTAIRNGVPLEGITIYPIIDRPDWDDLTHWHNSGLWDLIPDEQGVLRRVLNEEYAAVLRELHQDLAVARR